MGWLQLQVDVIVVTGGMASVKSHFRKALKLQSFSQMGFNKNLAGAGVPSQFP